jgi:hypothetical protein
VINKNIKELNFKKGVLGGAKFLRKNLVSYFHKLTHLSLPIYGCTILAEVKSKRSIPESRKKVDLRRALSRIRGH